jgi:hypothetical protein
MDMNGDIPHAALANVHRTMISLMISVRSCRGTRLDVTQIKCTTPQRRWVSSLWAVTSTPRAEPWPVAEVPYRPYGVLQILLKTFPLFKWTPAIAQGQPEPYNACRAYPISVNTSTLPASAGREN